MNLFKPALGALLTAAALASAQAAPVIGLSSAGNGLYDTYADLWTNVTNSAVATGFVPGQLVGPGAGAPYLTELRSQMVVGTMSNSNIPAIVTPPGLNTAFEISKVVRFQELVDLQTATTAHFTMPAAQAAAMDVDAAHPGVQNLAVFLDRIPGGLSTAVPGNGAGTVRCYGEGATSAGCGGPGDPDGDGTMIMSAHLVFNEASFTATGAVGTGSFDSRFVIDFVDPAFLDLVTGSIFLDRFTGTTNVPSFFTPAVMWDGTAPSNVPLLKVDSSQSFAALAVPEPATLALMGLGLGCLAFGTRRKPRARH
jgi:hypothetical protein